jgi:hypothetical protein
MNHPPRNVKNYRVQNVPNGCWNCKKRYLGMVSFPGNLPILGCKLACATPEKPSFCDQVDSFGICDDYENEKEA